MTLTNSPSHSINLCSYSVFILKLLTAAYVIVQKIVPKRIGGKVYAFGSFELGINAKGSVLLNYSFVLMPKSASQQMG